MQGTITKAELCEMCGFSSSTLRRYMNQMYFEDLKKVGYKTTQQILTPKILEKFFELFGEPFNEEE